MDWAGVDKWDETRLLFCPNQPFCCACEVTETPREDATWPRSPWMLTSRLFCHLPGSGSCHKMSPVFGVSVRSSEVPDPWEEDAENSGSFDFLLPQPFHQYLPGPSHPTESHRVKCWNKSFHSSSTAFHALWTSIFQGEANTWTESAFPQEIVTTLEVSFAHFSQLKGEIFHEISISKVLYGKYILKMVLISHTLT